MLLMIERDRLLAMSTEAEREAKVGGMNPTATNLWIALNATYDRREWAVMPEVADGTGTARHRWADAVAMNLWPSRGLELHGFEFKVSRSDWKSEMKKPEKAEAVAKYCERWWLVVSNAEIVAPGELPGGWGLLVLDGGELRVAVAAEKRTAAPFDRTFVAALLRAARMFVIPDDVVAATIESERLAIYESRQQERERERETARRELLGLEQRVQRFKVETGIDIHAYDAIPNAKQMMELVRCGGVEGVREGLVRVQREAKRIAEFVGGVLS